MSTINDLIQAAQAKQRAYEEEQLRKAEDMERDRIRYFRELFQEFLPQTAAILGDDLRIGKQGEYPYFFDLFNIPWEMNVRRESSIQSFWLHFMDEEQIEGRNYRYYRTISARSYDSPLSVEERFLLALSDILEMLKADGLYEKYQ